MKPFGLGFLRGALIVSLQAASVVMIQERSIAGAWIVSYAIAEVWIRNVRNTDSSEAENRGFKLGSACGAALVVWMAGM